MGLEVWGGIGLFALVLEVVTLSGFFLAVTVGAVFGALAVLFGAQALGSMITAAIAFGAVRGVGMILGGDDAILRYEEAGHNIVTDDGARVHIAQWHPYEDTLAEYQNRLWPVKLLPGYKHRAGDYRVVEVKEHHLLLAPLRKQYWPKRRHRGHRSHAT